LQSNDPLNKGKRQSLNGRHSRQKGNSESQGHLRPASSLLFKIARHEAAMFMEKQRAQKALICKAFMQ
jgi:hypothetical protein